MPAGFVDPACPIDWAHPLNRGLVAEWAVLPNSGWRGGLTFRDLARRRDATLVTDGGGPSPTWTGSGWRPGALGGVQLARVYNQYFSASRAPTGPPFTVAGWLRRPDTAGSDGVVIVGDGSTTYSSVVVDQPTGKVLAFSREAGVGSASAASTTTIAAGVPYFIVGVFASTSSRKIYVNGNLEATNTTTVAGTYDGGIRLAFGTNDRADGFLLFNRALSDAQVRGLYDQSRRGNPDRWRWVGARTWFPPTVAGATSYTLAAAAGAYALTGNAAGLRAARLLAAATGAYAITGRSATLLAARRTVGGTGAYVLTGQSAGLLKGPTLSAVAGAYTLAGNAATLRVARLLSAAAGAYALTGRPAGLLKGRTLTAAAGAYTLAGGAATLALARRITASPGAYVLTGNDAVLAYTIISTSGRVYILPATGRTYVLPGGGRTFILPASDRSYP